MLHDMPDNVKRVIVGVQRDAAEYNERACYFMDIGYTRFAIHYQKLAASANRYVRTAMKVWYFSDRGFKDD